MTTRERQRVHFRLILTPCCGHMLCWVNPRLPSYCPECGQSIYARLRFDGGDILVSDENGWLGIECPLPGPPGPSGSTQQPARRHDSGN